jgi:hypothetical protein
VAQWPDSFIGESIVKTALLFLRYPDAAQRVLRIVGRHADVVGGVYGVPVRIAGALRDPGPVASAQNRLQGRDQTAGRHAALYAARVIAMLVRFPIGDGEDPRAIQASFHEDLQAFRGPSSFRRVP